MSGITEGSELEHPPTVRVRFTARKSLQVGGSVQNFAAGDVVELSTAAARDLVRTGFAAFLRPGPTELKPRAEDLELRTGTLTLERGVKGMFTRDASAEGEIFGYGSVFGVLDTYGDIVMAGAFKESLRKRTPLMLWQHDSREPIGTWTDVHEDAHGLVVRGRLETATQRGREAAALVRSKALDGLSIGFILRDHDEDTKTGARLIKRVDLYEISLVSFPANESARVQRGDDHLIARYAATCEALERTITASRKRQDRLLADIQEARMERAAAHADSLMAAYRSQEAQRVDRAHANARAQGIARMHAGWYDNYVL
jgi:uncharacterized protein